MTREASSKERRLFLKKGILYSAQTAVVSAFGSSFVEKAFGAYEYSTPSGIKSNTLYKPSSDRPVTKMELATSYNNFYEFSLEKTEVKDKVSNWNWNEWPISISGAKHKKTTWSIEDLVKLAGGEEERIYRFRCVEGWAMVVPWLGIPLAKVIQKLEPLSKAKYVVFQSFSDRKMGVNMNLLPHYPWPYTEGLRIDEALNPLSFLATGMYGKPLPKQNGAPVRLVVPWKYGFKNIKSIVKIQFTDKRPTGLWEDLAPEEYGFYANVNPQVDHPRWSQKTERVLDGKLISKKNPTLLFNGYAEEVAHLYKDLDLKKNY